MQTKCKQLKPLYLKPYTTKEIRPSGWLKKQLVIQAEGLSGHLDEIWPDVRDSRWIGGTKEGWERVPYWLDGFIPLAYLLDEDDLKRRAKKYIDAILERQQEDGWICPCAQEERKTYDIWAAFLIGKVLVLYYDCTGDERIEPAVYRMLKSIDKHIEHATIFDWAATRWYEALISVYWMYERKPEDWLLQLAHKLACEGTDFKKLYQMLTYDKRPEEKYWDYLTHVVNQAMAIKSEGLYSRISGEEPGAFAKEMINRLWKYHGTVTGHFNGDECLSGTSPVQGTELCGVVEAMYSYEHLISLTGDQFFADCLERLAFNALPATISPDMWTHQYDQMTNQVECIRIPKEEVHFVSNSGESHIFGLEPNFGCCTANFNQGWPKFCLSVFMQKEDGVAVTALAPAVLHTVQKGVPVRAEVITGYPFRDTVEIKVEAEAPVSFTLGVRIPGFAGKAYVNGAEAEPGTFYEITREWGRESEEKITLQMEFETELVDRPNNLKAVRRGPLVYSIAIQEKWQEIKDDEVSIEFNKKEPVRKSVEHVYPYCDYEIYAGSPWNYAYTSMPFAKEEKEIGKIPFSPEEPPVQMKIKAVQIPWSSKNGVCAEAPDSLEPLGSKEEITLIPYGCTDIRMTEVPYLG